MEKGSQHKLRMEATWSHLERQYILGICKFLIPSTLACSCHRENNLCLGLPERSGSWFMRYLCRDDFEATS